MSEANDEDAMRQAFAEFMISGKKNTKANSSPVAPTHRTTPPATPTDTTVALRQQHTAFKKLERKYWQIYGAFQGSLKRDWLDVDDNLGQVMDSIATLRDRIPLESRYIEKKQQETRKEWQRYGFRNAGSRASLTVDDVQMALSHDLMQHEKMMAGARTLLASLAQAQEALGRRLEELMLQTLDMTQFVQVSESLDDRTRSSFESLLARTEVAQEVFSCLALELCRKQELVQDVLDAFQDDLIKPESDEWDAELDGKSIAVAERCSKHWPRHSKHSQIQPRLLETVLQEGETA
jgi:hypothetical protein